MAKERLIAAIDIGNSRIRTVVGSIDEAKKIPSILSVGVAPTFGLRKGQVIDVEETIQSISQALEEAERISGEPIHRVTVGISGSHIESFDARGVVAVSGEEIGDGDLERVLETAQAISIPNNYKVLKIIPKSFTIDGQRGIRYPVGMVGKKLEVEAHIICGLVPALKNIEKCVYEAGVDIDDILPAILAPGEAVLTKRQKELGVVVIDIGSGGTNVAVYEEGTLLYSTVIPVGGENVTNDIAIGLRTSLDIAEKLKIEYGTLYIDEVRDKDEVDLSLFSKQDAQRISKKHLVEVIMARYDEIFYLIKQELKKIGRDGMLPAGVILVGGGAKVMGSVDLARNILNLPVQLGFPMDTNQVVDKLDDPSFATVCGVLLWASRHDGGGYGFSFRGLNLNLNIGKNLTKAKDWVKSLLP